MEGYVTVREMAGQWGISPRTLQIMCAEGKITGAMKFGMEWAIPANAIRPADGRVKTGKYRNWRKHGEVKRVKESAE